MTNEMMALRALLEKKATEIGQFSGAWSASLNYDSSRDRCFKFDASTSFLSSTTHVGRFPQKSRGMTRYHRVLKVGMSNSGAPTCETLLWIFGLPTMVLEDQGRASTVSYPYCALVFAGRIQSFSSIGYTITSSFFVTCSI
jgi:hypothetical protein